jgi:hypothetical protein
MDDRIILVYCVCDDYLHSINHRDDPQGHVTDAEVMTIAIVAALYYDANFSMARCFLREQRYIKGGLGKSRFSRRVHRLKDHFLTLFDLLAEGWKRLNAEQFYAVDTFPVSALDNYRIPRAKLYRGEAYRGYIASKKRYFYGLKVHWRSPPAVSRWSSFSPQAPQVIQLAWKNSISTYPTARPSSVIKRTTTI